MPKRPYPGYCRRHDAILLAILQNPRQTQREIAKLTGYSPSQVSRIMCSPDFEARYEMVFHVASMEARAKCLSGLGPT